MTVISFFSSKGGAGKTTTCISMAQVLSEQGFKVKVIDADPNFPLINWYEKRGGVAPFIVEACTNDSKIAFQIKKASEANDFVLVDLEGTKNMKASHAVSKSDLVIIPFQRSNLDLTQAAEAVEFIKNQSEILERKIKYCLVLTKTSHLNTTLLRETYENIKQGSYSLSNVELYEREPFKNIFDYKKTLYELYRMDIPNKKKESIFKAIQNAEDFTDNVLSLLNHDLKEVA